MSTLSDDVAERIHCLLVQLAEEYPDLAGSFDAVRNTIVVTNEFSEQDTHAWVKLGEDVYAIGIDKATRFYHADIGLLSITEKFLLVPGQGVDLQTGDTVLWKGERYLITERREAIGLLWLKVDSAKVTFHNPPRGSHTYRQTGIRARIS